MTRHSKEKGFTLIEMMVVIVIIGILAAMIIVNVAGGRRKALATKAKTDVAEIDKAINMALSEGCFTISITAANEIKCSNPATLTNIYGVVPEPPNNFVYAVSSIPSGGSTTTTVTRTSTDGVVGSMSAATTFNSSAFYTISAYGRNATGGFKPVTGTTIPVFQCSNGNATVKPGCYCLTVAAGTVNAEYCNEML